MSPTPGSAGKLVDVQLAPLFVVYDGTELAGAQIALLRYVVTMLADSAVLLDAPAGALNAVELSPSGLHWDELDEDLSVAGMLAGLGAHSDRRSAAA